jgi:hypothetical protein
MLPLALALAAAGHVPAGARLRRYDLLFDCAMQADGGGANVRYALFVPGFTARFQAAAASGPVTVPDDEPDLEAFDPGRLIAIGTLSVPLVATRWDSRRRVTMVGLDVPAELSEGIHGQALASGEQGGTLRIDGIDRAAGTARARIVQYGDAIKRTVKAAYAGACSFTEGARALPAFESIKQ